MPLLSREDFQALYALEREAGSGLSVAELRKELSLTFPEGARVLTRGSEDYPQALDALADPPQVLCALGDLTLLDRQLLVSIVGSRNASSERCEAASFLASDLAARGAVIVSGLAAGIDRAAHEGALAAWTNESRRGRTAAVLGTPLSFPWPPENAKLYEEIVATGLALSEAPQAEGRRFDPNERMRSLRHRNRIVAALGTGTLVMAAAPGSSTLIEVDYALGLRRPVILWHECANEPWAKELLSRDLRDGDGRALVAVARDAVEVEEILSPWSRVWWL
ncbi:DNA-processing protein DprA [uncultured Sutterella sp.]|uniref:DNA-processing protein DprA n=1 Tax=uncultured Sutterella sp. TaxID=286133 RepID=UPI00259BB533|nr:DNA-processing protein DprA [uncultured Sutterella sp.]MBE5692058.1 DNA protecting protein DprA [Sutterella sp.]